MEKEKTKIRRPSSEHNYDRLKSRRSANREFHHIKTLLDSYDPDLEDFIEDELDSVEKQDRDIILELLNAKAAADAEEAQDRMSDIPRFIKTSPRRSNEPE